MRRSGDTLTMSTNSSTAGCKASDAIRLPLSRYGETTRSLPARRRADAPEGADDVVVAQPCDPLPHAPPRQRPANLAARHQARQHRQQGEHGDHADEDDAEGEYPPPGAQRLDLPEADRRQRGHG